MASPLEQTNRWAQVWVVASWLLNGTGNVGCSYRDLWSRSGQDTNENTVYGVNWWFAVGADDVNARQKFRITKEYSVDVLCQNQTPNTGNR